MQKMETVKGTVMQNMETVKLTVMLDNGESEGDNNAENGDS